ncbi:acetate kinase [Winogradskyella sp. DF17]|uniref:Acetate kinase n=1 Tax=Winogradskyella pelagia TaxID=2819984 RepID=A0ABS3T3J6_9FLAO|nr:acetate kinase [Winogradskyella sp. DF17]MBO3117318.1 acetate kinase [Winogradskyella sp. DF17]
MKVLVLNTGSSSVKYQLFKMPEELVLCSGTIERIGDTEARIRHNSSKCSVDKPLTIPTHKFALKYIVGLLLDKDKGEVQSIEEIEAVGHRVVHGGHTFKSTVEITSEVKSKIKELFTLAPLHNPSNLEGINVAESIFKKAKQAAIFDTSFHQTIPLKAYKYAIPNEFLDNHHIRLFGFHGTSHKYVSQKAIDYLDNKKAKIISIHLGNGCSISAIRNGESKDHSLGFSPFNGLIMGTRSGDIDHTLIFYLVNTLNYELDEVKSILQSKSGMLGLTGFNDLRDIIAEAKRGNKKCKLALEMNAYRIKKYIGSYVAAMNGLDCIIFTAGIGENSKLIREMVCSEMDIFGIELDEEKNNKSKSGILEINKNNSKVKILVIPTNEELEIARQTFDLFK